MVVITGPPRLLFGRRRRDSHWCVAGGNTLGPADFTHLTVTNPQCARCQSNHRHLNGTMPAGACIALASDFVNRGRKRRLLHLCKSRPPVRHGRTYLLPRVVWLGKARNVMTGYSFRGRSWRIGLYNRVVPAVLKPPPASLRKS